MKEKKSWEKDFEDAKTILNWNKIFMSSIGLWPKFNKFIFLPQYYYFLWHYLKDFVAFYMTLSSHVLMKVIGTGLECLTLSQIYVRLWTLKNYNTDFVTLLKDFEKDYSIKNYKTVEEKKVFLYYNSRSKKIILTSLWTLTFTALLYFFQPLLSQISKFLMQWSCVTHFEITSIFKWVFRFF